MFYPCAIYLENKQFGQTNPVWRTNSFFKCFPWNWNPVVYCFSTLCIICISVPLEQKRCIHSPFFPRKIQFIRNYCISSFWRLLYLFLGLMTIWELLMNCWTTIWRLFINYLTTILTTFWQRSNDFGRLFDNFWRVSNDLLVTFWRLFVNCLYTIWRLFDNFWRLFG